LLDEPSNDIDVETLEWLEQLIQNWKHIVLFMYLLFTSFTLCLPLLIFEIAQPLFSVLFVGHFCNLISAHSLNTELFFRVHALLQRRCRAR